MSENEKPRTPEEWVALMDQRVQDSTNWIERRQMLVNSNYYVGNQWITWDQTRRQVTLAPNANNEERVTHNVIRPRVMTKLAKQTKNRIKYEVVPDTNDEERYDVAKAATKFIKWWWHEQELDKKTRDIFLNNNVKGWCAAKVYFNAEAGTDITPDPEELEELDNDADEMGKMGKREKVYTGEIEVRICDPLTLFIDPSATSDDEIRWIVEEKPRDLDYILEMYGKKVSADPNVSYLTNYDVTSTNNNGIATGGQQRKMQDMAVVREMWVKPCKKYPNGLKITGTKTEILDMDENAGDLPYVLFGDIPIPGTVKYEAFIKDMLPVQREINIVRTMMATHAKRMGNSYWAVPMGSDVDEESLTNEEGAILWYNGTSGEPRRIAPNDIPSFYDRILDYGRQDIDDMSGAREISQGTLPSGLDTASGLSMMVEQENEKLAVTSQNYERGMKNLLQRVLELMKNHYTEERMARIIGEDSEIEVIAFRGADLSGGEDINIVQGSSLPEMKSAQEDRIMTLWKAGAIVKKDGSPDHETFLRLMGMGDSSELFEMNVLDENKAKLENKQFSDMMENPQALQVYQAYLQQKQIVDQHNQQMEMEAQNQGLAPDAIGELRIPDPEPPKGIPLIRDFQDHQIHLYYHNTFRKSNEYDELPYAIQKLVDAHVAEHEAMLGKSPEAQAAEQQAQAVEKQNQLKEQEMQMKMQIEQQKIAADGSKLQAQLLHDEMKMQQAHQNTLERSMLGNPFQR
jgi:hypothetical protein